MNIHNDNNRDITHETHIMNPRKVLLYMVFHNLIINGVGVIRVYLEYYPLCLFIVLYIYIYIYI